MCAAMLSHQFNAVLFMCIYVLEISAFNLEPAIPIVKRGDPRSHFGYSVAQHQEIDYIGNYKKPIPWLLVGAPKGINLQPGTNRSGALFKCPMTTYQDDCVQVKTDGFRNASTGLYDFYSPNSNPEPPGNDEIKDDQWLGVTLKSQKPGGSVLVCAHRYMAKDEHYRRGYGLCYILDNNLDVRDYKTPCVGKKVEREHQEFGFCQAGTSGLLLEDEVVLGVPGTYTWQGTIHTSNISKDYLLRDKTQYFGPVKSDLSPVEWYSYLGYSVTAGNFFGNGTSYIGGAPRSNGTGQVVFFSRKRISESILNVDLVLNGEVFASSFGFEVLAIDINQDGLDDLIVTAPFYIGHEESGAIYVYMNGKYNWSPNMPYSSKITGPVNTNEDTRYGFSITSMGDLNKDGYFDIAVGAPYEGNGAIYIYLGSEMGLIEKHVQKILAKAIPGPTYNAFGYSLSGGLDLDNNGYPDLLTSSFCSDRVLLIRSRPIIGIHTEVKPVDGLHNIDPTKRGCTDDRNSPDPCFSFDACFTIQNEANSRTALYLKYKIDEDFYSDQQVSRIRFNDDSENPKSSVERSITFKPKHAAQQKERCSREIVYLKSNQQDLLRPLRFKLSYEIEQNEPRQVQEGDPLPDIDLYPILNKQESERIFEAYFAKDCGSDKLCHSDLIVESDINLPRSEDNRHFLLELGHNKAIKLYITVTNDKEPAYLSNLYVNHHSSLSLSLKDSMTGGYQCIPSSTHKDTVHCILGNPFVNTTGELLFIFKPSGLPFNKRYIHFNIKANSSSEQLSDRNVDEFRIEVIKKAEISIKGLVEPEQVFYGGDIIGESAIKHLEQIGSRVTHKYVVDNSGPWKVDELKVKIMWPHQVENNKDKGKWLLYMTQQPTVDGDGECELDEDYINPLYLRRRPYNAVESEPESDSGTEFLSGDKIETDESGSEGVIIKETTSTKVTKKVSSKKTVTTADGTRTHFSSSSKDYKDGELVDYDYDYDYDYDLNNKDARRQNGARQHNRVSRKVYGGRGRKNQNELQGQGEGEGEGEGQGEVESQGEGEGEWKTDADGNLYREKTIRKYDESVTRRIYTSESGSRHGFDDYGDDKSISSSRYSPPVTYDANAYNNFESRGSRGNEFDSNLDNRSGGIGYERKEYSRRRYSSSSSGSSGGSRGGNVGKDDDDYDYSHYEERRTYGGKGDADGDYAYSRTYSNRDNNNRGRNTGRDARFRNYDSFDRDLANSDIGAERNAHFNRTKTTYRRTHSSSGGYSGSTSSSGSIGSSGSGSSGISTWSENSESRNNNRNHNRRRNYNYDYDYPTEDSSNYAYTENKEYRRRSKKVQSGGEGLYKKTHHSQKGRWSSGGGFKDHHSNDNNEYDYDNDDNYDYENHGSSATYNRAVVDDKTGNTHVYSHQVFSRNPNEKWEEVSSFNPELPQFQDDETSLKRVKRERELVIKPEPMLDPKTGHTMQVVNFKCTGDNPTAKCIRFKCTIRNLGAHQAASIRIISRLWNSTLVEDYPRVSSVRIQSHAQLELPADIIADQDTSDDQDSAETTAYPNLLEQLPPQSVPLWVILVSIFAGILVLVIIVLVLWKLGFFERKRPDPTLSGY